MCKVCDDLRTFAPGAAEDTIGMEDSAAFDIALKNARAIAQDHLDSYSAARATFGDRIAINGMLIAMQLMNPKDVAAIVAILTLNVVEFQSDPERYLSTLDAQALVEEIGAR